MHVIFSSPLLMVATTSMWFSLKFVYSSCLANDFFNAQSEMNSQSQRMLVFVEGQVAVILDHSNLPTMPLTLAKTEAWGREPTADELFDRTHYSNRKPAPDSSGPPMYTDPPQYVTPKAAEMAGRFREIRDQAHS